MDISDYRSYIHNTPDIYTYVSIPNNVDSTYTGVIAVTVSLTVYLVDEYDTTYSRAPKVMPLTNATQGMNDSLWTICYLFITQLKDCVVESRFVETESDAKQV